VITPAEWEVILRGCIAWDRLAWKKLVHTLRPFVLYTLRKRLNDEDTVLDQSQEVFLKLVENDCRRLRDFDFDRGVPFEAYIRVIALNHGTDWNRSHLARSSEREVDLEALIDCLGIEPSAEKRLLVREVLDVVERLPAKDGTAVRLQLEGWKIREIGDVLGMTTGGVSSLLHRAIQKLSDLLGEAPDDEKE
jgi:RNA polymerase sigma factor (sigma-70 family)